MIRVSSLWFHPSNSKQKLDFVVCPHGLSRCVHCRLHAAIVTCVTSTALEEGALRSVGNCQLLLFYLWAPSLTCEPNEQRVGLWTICTWAVGEKAAYASVGLTADKTEKTWTAILTKTWRPHPWTNNQTETFPQVDPRSRWGLPISFHYNSVPGTYCCGSRWRGLHRILAGFKLFKRLH